MATASLTIDASQVTRNLARLSSRITPKMSRMGVGEASLAILRDTIAEIPTTPIKKSFLRGSGSIFVQDVLVATAAKVDPGLAAKDKFVNRTHAAGAPKDVVIGTVGFNAHYAAMWHENEPTGWQSRRSTPFTEPTAGRKYLESKMQRNQKQYFAIMQRRIIDELSAAFPTTRGGTV